MKVTCRRYDTSQDAEMGNPATPELYNLVLSFRWDLATARCRSHPQDVAWRDDRGYTPLHRLACFRGFGSAASAAETARSMLRAADEIDFGSPGHSRDAACTGSSGDNGLGGALRLCSDRGNRALWSPLHLLCRHGGYGNATEGLVLTLLLPPNLWGQDRPIEGLDGLARRRARHVALLRDRQGRTALHTLCEASNLPVDGTVSTLLSVDPSMVLCLDKQGKTPLACLVELDDKKNLSANEFSTYYKFFLGTAGSVLFPDARPDVTYRRGDDDDSDIQSCEAPPIVGPVARRNLVHTAVRVPAAYCPVSIVARLALNEHPRYVRERDEDGNLPLHVFAANRGDVVRLSALDAAVDTSSRLARKADERKSRALAEQDDAFGALINAFPSSPRLKNGEGKFALEVAIGTGTTWVGGVRRLLHAYPTALAAMEVDYELYPRILALTGGGTKADHGQTSLNAMFELVRDRPDLMQRHGSVREQDLSFGHRQIPVFKKLNGMLSSLRTRTREAEN